MEESMKTAYVLIAEGFEEVEALTPVDYLRRAGIDVLTLGVGPDGGPAAEVQGGHGIAVRADRPLGASDALRDAIIVPGGGGGVRSLAASPAAIDLIRRHHAAGKLVAAICAAPAVVLHEACGLLGGASFTGFPGTEAKVSGARFSPERVVRDGQLITSRAAGTAGEFSRGIIAALVGEDIAREVADKVLL
jgi:4-methyl-5(b-hydroxyethyl)-thiazole monophosphate biosynthesis